MKRKGAVARGIRLIQIRELLQERARTVAELADLCGVSEPTIYRDIADLQSEPLWTPIIKTTMVGLLRR